ncbi:lytic murein transglycosylase B [Suttonella sp. R2A3]|uniref:lytic murein transglycosylase B n=1 Tax=Suttonella sp. R2A3 TaxID=2908648 RepID=UPI001F1A5A0D|nr:lytic murein transglycosylase B [Suttonella sp. R2A3]UJF24295.1 lytic murein transglycosylase B [Suttonella sp. R2A3]
MRQILGWCALVLAMVATGEEAETVNENSYAFRDEALARANALAENEGFDEAYLQSLLLAVEPDESVLEKISRPAEKTKTWAEYRPIFLDQARIDNGVAFWDEYAEVLSRAEETFGVDPAIVVAIIGVETRYGKVTGNTPAFAALSTLCFDYPKRAAFFCEQWDEFLRLARRENWNPLQIQGSYAGAMGMGQFMPTSYTNDALDYDGDGKVDLWNSADDAIGSVANYLANRDWESGGKYVERLEEAPTAEHFGQSHKPYFDRNSLFEKKQEDEQIVMEQKGAETPVMVGSLVLEGLEGEEWWLTYHNFFVITRYNTSPLYAMAVIDLAAELREQREDQTSDDE